MSVELTSDFNIDKAKVNKIVFMLDLYNTLYQ